MPLKVVSTVCSPPKKGGKVHRPVAVSLTSFEGVLHAEPSLATTT
jgi:hypothetical protein